MNNQSKSVVDISEGRENKVAVISDSGGISWRNDNLHPSEMRWIVDYVKNKNTNKGVFTIWEEKPNYSVRTLHQTSKD